MVERDLAKVEVAGSNPVSRSTLLLPNPGPVTADRLGLSRTYAMHRSPFRNSIPSFVPGRTARVVATLVVISSWLSACTANNGVPPGDAPAATKASGFVPAELSSEVRPQDDFFNYVNANWIAANEIPADRSSYGIFNVVFDRTELQVRELIENAARSVETGAAGADETRIGALYLSFMDEQKVNELGIEPIADLLRAVDAVQTPEELVTLFGRLQRLDVTLPVVYYVDGDAADPERSLAYFWQGGLGLPDRDYYSKDGAKFVEVRAKYLEYIETLYALAGWPGGEQAAATIFGIEKHLAERHWSRVQNRDRQRIYTNKVEVAENANAWFWKALLGGGEFGAPKVVVLAQDDYFASLPELVRSTSLKDWQTYTRLRLLDAFAGYLTTDLAAASFEFRGKVLRGQEEQRPRWKRGVSTVNALLGEQVGKLYVADHFPPTAKAKIAAMVENLRGAFGTSIDALPWMAPATKAEAQAKLAAFNKKVGYPDVWRDYSSLTMQPDALVRNVRIGREFENARQIGKLSKPVDRTEWGMTPQTINAYYRPTFNEIVFPAAILQPPFFDPAVDDAFNYGAIGAVIGHEFSHGFDDQGRKFDGTGALRDWWTEADTAAYSERAAKLVAQYNEFQPLPDVSINGQLTLGENIGDLAGLTMAYRAYRAAVDEEYGKAGAPVLDGFTGDQRFFIGYAHAWRGQYRDEALRERLLSDPHSPAQYRVIGVLRNMDAFYRAFDVTEDDGMYLPPAERVRIW